MSTLAIPAITVYQPWASMIACGLKRFEFRGWVPPQRFMRRPVAIHASVKTETKKTLQKYLDAYEGTAAIPIIEAAMRCDLPTGSVLCTAEITGVLRANGLVEPITGKVVVNGGFAWRLEKIKTFPQPLPAKGAQGFWWWTQPAGTPAKEEQLVIGRKGI